MWEILRVSKSGKYNYGRVPNHPKANSAGLVLLHRLIMENFLGRILEDNEVVHHIDFDSHNNNIENLKLMTRSEHTKFHDSLREKNFIKKKCLFCGKEFEVGAQHKKQKCCSVTCARKKQSGETNFMGNNYEDGHTPRRKTHGTENCYAFGCRCDECKSAHAKKAREARAKKK